MNLLGITLTLVHIETLFFPVLEKKMNKEAEANVKYHHVSSAPSNAECIMYCQLIYSIKIFLLGNYLA